VEERHGARRVTQQRFDLAEEPPDPSEEGAAQPPEALPPTVPPLPIPREASDLGLRERQMRWVRARLEFEARGEPAKSSEGPK
jgi:hypothetical protein